MDQKKEMEKKEAEKPHRKKKYFEVFGDYVSRVNFQQTLIIVLVGIIVFLLICLNQAMKKTPIVIRVDSLGNTEAFSNIKSLQNITKPEINNFTENFLTYYTVYNFYSVKDDFAKAGKMMTKKMFEKAADYLKTSNIIDDIIKRELKTSMKITHITVLKDTPDFIAVRVKGTRFIETYLDDTYKNEEAFDIELSIKKVPRTLEAPYGLLVDNFKEELYKK